MPKKYIIFIYQEKAESEKDKSKWFDKHCGDRDIYQIGPHAYCKIDLSSYNKDYNLILINAEGEFTEEDFGELFSKESLSNAEVILLAHEYRKRGGTSSGVALDTAERLLNSGKILNYSVSSIVENTMFSKVFTILKDKDLSSLPSWDEIKKNLEIRDIKNSIRKFLLALTPLHLALQAFWGVAVEEVPSDLNQPIKFVKIGTRDGNEFLKKINKQRKNLGLKDVNNEIKEEYRKLFPNPDAFLLVQEAEYDFFAPLINFFVEGEKGIADGKSANCDEEKDIYEMPTLKEVIEEIEKQKSENNEFFADLKSALQYINAHPCEPNIKNGTWTYDPQEFVSFTREVCAILANTNECEKNGKEFGYKGNNKENVQAILESLGFVERSHYKLENYKSDYSILVNQLIFWGLKKALVVIGGIEVIAAEIRKICITNP